MARRQLNFDCADEILDSPPPILSTELLELMPVIFLNDEEEFDSNNNCSADIEVVLDIEANNVVNVSPPLAPLLSPKFSRSDAYHSSDDDIIQATPERQEVARPRTFNIPESPSSASDVPVDGNMTEEAKRTRKRKRQPGKWKRNVRIKLREEGKEYTDINNNAHAARKMRGRCYKSKGCCFKCEEKLSIVKRLRIFERFWSLSEEKKQHFYGKFVTCKTSKRKRTESKHSRRVHSFAYYFEVDRERIQVCRHFFLTTLDISQKRIYYCFKNRYQSTTGVAETPVKGKNLKRRISETTLEAVRSHIKAFPVIESHYCRASTEKQFLDSKLNIMMMHDLYMKSDFSVGNPVKLHKYREIFNTEFNLSFFIPKKDRCDHCEKFKLNFERSEDDKVAHEKHMTSKVSSKAERDKDRIIQREKGETAVISFDLQNAFSLPKANVSNFFYKRKFSAYNLTANCSSDGVTYCAFWHEAVAGRGANHLASAMNKILLAVEASNPTIKKVILWSDSCVPQNRNKIMSVALMNFLNNSTNISSIIQKFSEPGHGLVQEVDAIHSKIEKFLKHSEIFSPLSLLRILTEIPARKAKLQILQMTEKDFFSYSSVSDLFLFTQVPYSKVKLLSYQKASMVVEFAVSFNGELQKANLCIAERKRRKKRDSTRLTVLPEISQIRDKASLKNNKEKVKDIRSMLPFMPECDRSYYEIILGKYCD